MISQQLGFAILNWANLKFLSDDNGTLLIYKDENEALEVGIKLTRGGITSAVPIPFLAATLLPRPENSRLYVIFHWMTGQLLRYESGQVRMFESEQSATEYAADELQSDLWQIMPVPTHARVYFP